MNLIYGEVVEILTENEMKFGKVRVGRAFQTVPLDLLVNVACGDSVLVCDGVAVGKVEKIAKPEERSSKHQRIAIPK